MKLVVHGAAGRMGRRVIALALEDADVELVAGVDSADHPAIGSDLGSLAGGEPCGVALGAQWPQWAEDQPRAVIDFSLPGALDACLRRCRDDRSPLVVATTGLTGEQRQRIADAGQVIPICWAPSMSLAVNLTMRLASEVTAALRDVSGGIDVEIIERHHRYKEDAPSGTALKFGELIAAALQPDDAEVEHVHGRHGKTGRRSRSQIGYHAVRAGDHPGEHTIVFGMLGEKIELNVAASNRDCYASGALAAAKWLQPREAGVYDMFDVLGLNPR